MNVGSLFNRFIGRFNRGRDAKAAHRWEDHAAAVAQAKHEEPRKGLLEKLAEIAEKIANTGRGRAGQRTRWYLRRQERELTGRRLRAVKGSTKCAQRTRGAFGKPRGPFDGRPALRPKQMKELADRVDAARVQL